VEPHKPEKRVVVRSCIRGAVLGRHDGVNGAEVNNVVMASLSGILDSTERRDCRLCKGIEI
jgi:hypothetical protein